MERLRRSSNNGVTNHRTHGVTPLVGDDEGVLDAQTTKIHTSDPATMLGRVTIRS